MHVTIILFIDFSAFCTQPKIFTKNIENKGQGWSRKKEEQFVFLCIFQFHKNLFTLTIAASNAKCRSHSNTDAQLRIVIDTHISIRNSHPF